MSRTEAKQPKKIGRLIKWHRRLALVAVVFLLGSTISGLSRTADKAIPSPDLPSGPQTTFASTDIVLSAAQAATRLPPGSVVAASECRMIAGEPWWQFILQSPRPIFAPDGQFGPPLMVQPKPVYVHAQTGAIAGGGFDEMYALELAADLVGNGPELRQQLVAFNMDYAIIHRLRPVYEISSSSGPAESVFISTHHGAASTWLNDRKRIDKSLFSVLHKYFFIRNKYLREGLQIALNALMIISAMSGIFMWWRMRQIRTAPTLTRRLHAQVGLVAFVGVLLGASSGILHNAMVLALPSPPPPQPISPPQVELAVAIPGDLTEVVAVAVVQINGQTAYQLRYADGSEPQYVDAGNGEPIVDGELLYAASIAATAIGLEPEYMGRKTAFDVDYGRINKFIPVTSWRATDASYQGVDVHVSTVTGTVTRSTTPLGRAQIRAFSWLHSLSWLPEPIRTIVLIALGGAILLSTILGLWLFMPKFWKRSRT